MDKTSLGDRMKDYEACTQGTLLRRTPVIIRVDGKAFHTFTKRNLEVGVDPFNHMMHKTMVGTMQAMMQNMQNAVFGYTQSDEISILLRDWDKHETQQWFGGKIQKIVSVSAAMATGYFNFLFQPGYSGVNARVKWVGDVPLFDSRVFQVPMEEVTNYFVWRQQDATRNSVQMLGRHYMSHGDMNGQNVSNVQDMLMSRYGVNWNAIDTWKKRGTCVVPNPDSFDSSSAWFQDEEIPIFTKDRSYVEDRLIGVDHERMNNMREASDILEKRIKNEQTI